MLNNKNLDFNQKSAKHFSQLKAWAIWFLLSLFYFYEYYLRTAPSIMQPQLVNYFHLGVVGLGSLIGAYYYTYAPSQIFAGLLFDRFGGKLVLPMACGLCTLGSILFIEPNIYIANLGRLLMGFGSGFGFMGIIFVAGQWIDKKRLALLSGLTQTVGMLGAILGQKYASFITQHFSWKNVWIQAFYAGISLVFLIYFTIPNAREQDTSTLTQLHRKEIFQNFWSVIKNKQTWFAGLFSGFIFLPTSVFAMIWAVPFFATADHFTIAQITNLTSAVFIGWIIGSPLAGFISDYVQSRKWIMLIGIFATLILFTIVVYLPHLNEFSLLLCMFGIGLFSGVELVAIAFTCEANRLEARGSAIGITDCIIFSISAIFSPLIGVLLKCMHSIHLVFSIDDYQWAFLSIILCLSLGTILCFFVKENRFPEC